MTGRINIVQSQCSSRIPSWSQSFGPDIFCLLSFEFCRWWLGCSSGMLCWSQQCHLSLIKPSLHGPTHMVQLFICSSNRRLFWLRLWCPPGSSLSPDPYCLAGITKTWTQHCSIRIPSWPQQWKSSIIQKNQPYLWIFCSVDFSFRLFQIIRLRFGHWFYRSTWCGYKIELISARSRSGRCWAYQFMNTYWIAELANTYE